MFKIVELLCFIVLLTIMLASPMVGAAFSSWSSKSRRKRHFEIMKHRRAMYKTLSRLELADYWAFEFWDDEKNEWFG